jgi:hypothetical protein
MASPRAHWILLATLASPAWACTHGEPVGSVELRELAGAPGTAATRTVELVARTPYLPTYPCGEQCHDDRVADPTPRALALFHVGRTVEHGPALDFCNDCHAMDDVDQLVLLDGTTHVGFDASDPLCAQCHGGIHDDWEAGIHGLTTGGWQGTVQRRLCTACHDPHAPGPLHFQALPVPVDARGALRPHHGAAGHEGAGHEGAGHEGAGHEGAGHEGAGHERAGHEGEGT